VSKHVGGRRIKMATATNSRVWGTILLTITIFSLSFPTYAKYSGGTGEPNDPYQIATAAELILMGNSPEDYDKHFILTADIDLNPILRGREVFNRAVIAPQAYIGTGWDSLDDLFTGVFNGNGHTISNLAVSGEGYLGLFGRVGFGAKVFNLGLVAVDVYGTGSYVGALVGYNWGDLIHCYSTGTVRGEDYVGGLVGADHDFDDPYDLLNSSIRECFSTGTVTGNSGVGGLVGWNSGNVMACYSTSQVSADSFIGGLVGINGVYPPDLGWQGTISDCYSTGQISSTQGIVGGLVGSNTAGTVTRCYSIGSTDGSYDVGGLVGLNKDTENKDAVTQCFWDIETSGQVISDDGTGKTTAEIQMATTFLDAGWDFVGETDNGTDDIWKMWDGYDYPRLQWEPGPNTPLVFVDINDPGFYGQMSKYEVTNAQYCDFLNAALASGDIMVNGTDVYGAGGSKSGGNYAGQRYYRCDGSGYSGCGATNGGASRIHYSEGAFSVDKGFGNHPVTYVSWYGAMAFCNYYGYYLPTEDQWQAVADYDGTYIYGCGETIDPGIANYRYSEHPNGTTSVSSFGAYGYGMSDMAGNVWEWTSSGSDSFRIFRGGGWYSYDSDCAVSIKGDGIPYANYSDIGFRVCR
jgi:hypothetical protein